MGEPLPSPGGSTLHVLFHLIITKSLREDTGFPHFTCEEMKTEMLSNLFKVTLVIWVRTSISTLSDGCQTSHLYWCDFCFFMEQTASLSQSDDAFTVAVWQVGDEYLMSKWTSVPQTRDAPLGLPASGVQGSIMMGWVVGSRNHWTWSLPRENFYMQVSCGKLGRRTYGWEAKCVKSKV